VFHTVFANHTTFVTYALPPVSGKHFVTFLVFVKKEEIAITVATLLPKVTDPFWFPFVKKRGKG
jgi:hypothetical protein